MWVGPFLGSRCAVPFPMSAESVAELAGTWWKRKWESEVPGRGGRNVGKSSPANHHVLSWPLGGVGRALAVWEAERAWDHS